MSLTRLDDQSVTLSRARQMVCLEAAWELEHLAKLLPSATRNDADGACFVARAIADRLTTLSHVLMSGLDDEVVPTADLAQRVLLESEGG